MRRAMGRGLPAARAALAERVGTARLDIVSTASSQVGATAVTSLLGFCYWWLAARRFPPAAVGLGGASVSAMLLLGNIAALGLGTLLMGELRHQRGRVRSLTSAGLMTSAVAGMLLGTAFALIASRVSPNLHALGDSATAVVLFGCGVAATSLTVVLDQALLGLLRGKLQFERNSIFAGGKLLILGVIAVSPVAKTGLAIYATWLAGSLASLAWPMWVALREDRQIRSYLPHLRLLRRLGRRALLHHGLNLSLQLPNMMLPVLATSLLSVEAGGFFYTAWMLAGFVSVGPYALTMSLYAVAANDPSALRTKIRFTLRLAGLIAAIGSLPAVAAAPYLLLVFGPAYVHQATWPFRFIVLGVFPLIVKDHFVAVKRIQARLLASVLGVSLGSLLEVALAFAGAAVAGLPGLAAGWVVAVCLEAGCMVPTVVGIVHGRPYAWRLR